MSSTITAENNKKVEEVKSGYEEVFKSSSRKSHYFSGALIGATLGAVLSMYFGRRLLVGAVVGMVAGGYIGSQIEKTKSEYEPKIKKQ